MSTYLKHLTESDREYHFRIKTTVPVDEDMMARIENLLHKYELRDISAPIKTIIQEHPLDFQDIHNTEVFIIDAVTGVPVSSYVLLQELRTNLKIPEKFIVVRSDNDPLEVETARINAANDMEQEAEDKGLNRKSLLDTNEEYPEAADSVPGEKLYGDEHNSDFLNTLANVSAERQPTYSEPSEGLFNWLINDIEEAGEGTFIDDTFNKDIDGVRPVPWWEAGKVSDARDKLSPEGTFDDDSTTHNRTYEDDTGKETKIKKEITGVRG